MYQHEDILQRNRERHEKVNYKKLNDDKKYYKSKNVEE